MSAPRKFLEITLTSLRSLHSDALRRLREAQAYVQSGSASCEEISDLCHLMRKTSELADDLRKEMDSARETSGEVAAITWTTLNATKKNLEPIHGEISTGSIKLKMIPKLPSKKNDPEMYARLMKSLGLPADAPAGVFSLHWPNLVEHLTAVVAKGGKCPDGIDPSSLHPKYTLETRGIHGTEGA